MNKNLHLFRFNKFSQNGEDGVIEEIINRIFKKKDNLNVCEFGLGDIDTNSNTFFLIEQNKVKNALLIETNKDLYLKSKKKTENIPTIELLNTKIEIQGPNSLDNILDKKNYKNDLDILSIDIDSYDLDIYRSIKLYFPKLLIIEAGRQPYGILHEYKDVKLKNLPFSRSPNSFTSIYREICHKFYLVFFNGNMFFLNKNIFEKKEVEKLFHIDDELHYLMHKIYRNSLDSFKKNLIRLIPQNKRLIKFLIKLLNKN